MRPGLAAVCCLLLPAACGGPVEADLGTRIAVGYVRDADTRLPVPGARIAMFDPPTGAKAVTDEAGEFRIELPSPGAGKVEEWSADQVWPYLWIRVEAEGYRTDEHWIQNELPRRERAGPWIDLEREPPVVGVVRGTVAYPSGRPAVRVPVELRPPYPADPIEVVTDEDGRFGPVPVPAGYLRIEAEPEAEPSGEVLVFVPPRPEGDLVVEVPLPRQGEVAGTVRDEGDRPVAGARVCGLGYGGAAETDADGRFRLPGAAGAEVRVRVEKEGFHRYDGDFLDGEAAEIGLRRRRWIEGTLRLPDGTRAGAGLRLEAGGGDGLTEEDGSFSVETSYWGRDFVMVFLRNAPLGQVEVQVPEGVLRYHHDLQLPPPRETGGVVVDDLTGEPLAGVLVRPFGVVTDRAGRYRVAWPSPWRDEIQVSYLRRGYERHFLHREAQDVPDTVRLTPLARIRVRAVDAEGRPVRGAFAVSGGAYLCDPPEWIWTDRDGSITYECHAHANAGFTLVHPTRGRADVDAPNLRPGEHRDLGDQVLEPEPVWSAPTLLATDEHGRPLSGAYAVAVPRGDHILAADDGGRVQLCIDRTLVTAPGREAFIIDSEAVLLDRDPTRELVLRESAPIRGTVLDLRGHGIAGEGIYMWKKLPLHARNRGGHEVVTDALGRFEMWGALPGEAVKLLVGEKEIDARGGDEGLVIRMKRPDR